MSERQEADLRLRHAEEELRRYEAIVSAVSDPISYVGRDYVYRAVNDTYARFAKRPKDEIVGLTVDQLLGRDAFERYVKPHLEQCFAGEEVHYQAWFDVPQEGRKFMDVGYYPVFGPGGIVQGAAVSSRDITEQKRAEAALQRERDLVAQIMETSPVGIVVLDRRGRITYANEQVAQATGFARDQIAQASYNDPRWRLVDEGGRPLEDRLFPFHVLMDTGQPVHGVEYVVKLPGDRELILSLNAAPLVGESGALNGAVISFEDVTERKRAERALRESRAFFQSALDALSANIAVLDEEGRIVAVNASWRRFGAENGLTWDEGGVGRNYLAALDVSADEPDRNAQAAAQGIRDVIAGKRMSYWQEYPCHSPWEERWFGMSVTHFGSSEGARTVVSHENITQRKLAEIALRRAKETAEEAHHEAESARHEEEQRRREAERRREVAVAEERNRLARDLHDAVTQTLFSASVIAESIPRIWERYPDEAQQGLEELRQLTRGALAEMRTLLIELRPAGLTEKPLGDLLRNLTEATTSRTRVPIELSVEGNGVLPPDVQITLYRIAQEALNNIAKYAESSQVVVTLQCQMSKVELAIQDNGPGFDVEQIPAGHMGIGIMRERAQEVGAQLEVLSQPGQGTLVTVRWRGRERKESHDGA
jgi:PAS domain S-box-containing protein